MYSDKSNHTVTRQGDGVLFRPVSASDGYHTGPAKGVSCRKKEHFSMSKKPNSIYE